MKDNLKKPEKYEHDASEFGSKTKNMTPEEQKAQKEGWAFNEGIRQGTLIGTIILCSIPVVIVFCVFIKFSLKGIYKIFVGDTKNVFKKEKK